MCLLTGAAALVAFLRFGRSAGGAVFIAALVALHPHPAGAPRAAGRTAPLGPGAPGHLATATMALFADVLIAALR